MQAEFSLSELDPVGQHVVVVIDLVGELTDVVHRLGGILSLRLVQVVHLVDDTVDKRRDGVH